LHAYCVDVLAFDDGAAYKRIHAARAARTFPVIFELVASGAIHLSGITVIAPHLTAENHHGLLERASRKTKRQIEELVAAIAPKPDVPPQIRKLPGSAAPSLFTHAPLAPKPAATTVPAPKHDAPRPEPRAVVAPLSEERFKVQFTASRGLRDKIATAKALLGHVVPDGDLEQVFDRAVDALLEKLAKRKHAATDKPRTKDASAPLAAQPKRTRALPASVERAVMARDNGQCTFVSASGRRCTEREKLEFHHEHAFAMGGAHDAANVRLLCRAHNSHLADRDFGADFMRAKKRKHAPQPVVSLFELSPGAVATRTADP
jgi:5-methylcytosine-specific restriction endonuclease McrA